MKLYAKWIENALELANAKDNREPIIEAITSGKLYNVTLADRILYKDGDWNTLCLPFDVDDFTGTPLEGATVKTLTSTSFEDGMLTMTFTDYANNLTAIEAGVPYIVKWNKPDGYNVNRSNFDISDPVFEGVTIRPPPPKLRPTMWTSSVPTHQRLSMRKEARNITSISALRTASTIPHAVATR